MNSGDVMHSRRDYTALHWVPVVGYFCVVVVVPLAAGGSLRWAWSSVGIALSVLWGVWITRSVLVGRLTYCPSPFYGVLLVLGAVMVLQLVPAEAVIDRLSPMAATYFAEARTAGAAVDRVTLSLAPSETRLYLLYTGILLFAFCLAMNCYSTRRERSALALAVVLSGVVNALIGLVEECSESKKLFWYLGSGHGIVQGTFENKNHFALLLELGILLACGLLLGAGLTRRARRRHHARPASEAADDRWDAAILPIAGFSVMTMTVAMLFSFSRAGTFAASLGVTVLLLLALSSQGKRRLRALLAGGLVGVAVVLGGQRGLDRVWSRFEDVMSGPNMSGRIRWDLWQSSLRVMQDHWRCGVGMGAFNSVGPRYESIISPDRITYHPVNDWLEFACEIGVPLGGGLAVVMLVLLCIITVRVWRCPETYDRWLGLGACAALFAVALHECFGFGLRKPGNFIPAVSVLALASQCARWTDLGRGREDKAGRRAMRSLRLDSWTRRGAVLVAGWVIVGVFLWQAVPYAVSGVPLERLRARVGQYAPKSRMTVSDEAEYRVGLAEKVLALEPANPEAQMQLAGNTAILGACELRDALAVNVSAIIGRTVAAEELDDPELAEAREEARQALTPAVRSRIEERFAEAVGALRRACGMAPTRATYFALLGQELARLGQFRGEVDEEAVKRAYDWAHETFPRVGRITMFCAEGAWYRFIRQYARVDDVGRRELHDAAIDLFGQALWQSPGRARTAYSLIWSVYPDPDLLRSITPDFIVAHEALYRFLFHHRRLDACLVTLNKIGALNETRPAREHLRDEAPFIVARRDQRTKPAMAQLVRQREILLLGLMGRWDARAERTSELAGLEAAETRDKVRAGYAFMEEGQIHRADVLARNALDVSPTLPEALILHACVRDRLGDQSGAARLLLRLVWHHEKLTTAIGQQALALVERISRSIEEQGRDSSPVVWNFLKGALHYRLGHLDEAQGILSQVTSRLGEESATAWFESPVVHYFHGCVLEDIGLSEPALMAYVDALAGCAGHVKSRRRAQAILRALSEQATERLMRETSPVSARILRGLRDEIVGNVPTGIPVDTSFGGKLRLLRVAVTPQEIRGGQGIEICLEWMCEADLERDYTIKCTFFRGNKATFSDTLSLGSTTRAMVGWCVGEAVTVQRSLNPMKLGIRQTRRRLRSGWYDMRVRLRATGVKSHGLAPEAECRIPLFRITDAATAPEI